MAKSIKAFVAKSFAPEDEASIQPILGFLETFSPLGLILESADHAESEEVSTKVKRMIDDAGIFVAIFTKKYPICEFTPDNSLCHRLHQSGCRRSGCFKRPDTLSPKKRGSFFLSRQEWKFHGWQATTNILNTTASDPLTRTSAPVRCLTD